jgi:hypothetical protein
MNPHVQMMREQAEALRNLDEKQLWRLALDERRAERGETQPLDDFRYEVMWQLRRTGVKK